MTGALVLCPSNSGSGHMFGLVIVLRPGKQFFSRVGTDRSYIDGASILCLTKGCPTKASSLIKEVPGVTGVGDRATLDIQFKMTNQSFIYAHLF